MLRHSQHGRADITLRQGGLQRLGALADGLGPAITKRQIEPMGGTLALDSPPGEGSRFCFALELASADGALTEIEALIGKLKRLDPAEQTLADEL